MRPALQAAVPGYTVDVSDSGREYKVCVCERGAYAIGEHKVCVGGRGGQISRETRHVLVLHDLIAARHLDVLQSYPFFQTPWRSLLLHSPLSPSPSPPRQVYLNLAGDIEPPEFRDNPGSTLHLWSAKDDTFMSFTAHRNPDDTYSGTFRCGMMMLCVWKCGTHTGWRNVCVVCVEVWMSYMGPLPSALLCCTPQPCTAGLAPPHACMHAPWSTPHHARYSMHSVTSFPPFPPT